jgi:Mrp family chromosome partitioning ATPase
MEKIQKALEKSFRDQNREAERGAPASGGDTVPFARVNGARANGEAPQPGRPANRGYTNGHGADEPTQPLQVEYTQTRVIAPPKRRLLRRRLIAGQEEHQLSDTFRILRTRVLNRMEANGYQTLGIASAVGREGKTLIASNLAISMARVLTRTVLLVDLDMRSPSVHKYFGVDPRPGLETYLRKDIPLSECLINPGIDRLVLLPTGKPVRNSSELITGPKMTRLARELRETYPDRLIVYDLPPVLQTDDALAFLKYVDCGLLVASEGHTRESDLERVTGLLEDYPLIGTVFNRSSEQPKRYYGSR